MVSNDELQKFMCKKYDYICENCNASLYNSNGLKIECGFDKVEDSFVEYIKDQEEF